MSRRPIILSFTTAMHEAGMNLLREGSELRIASSLKPETLRREVVDADALVIRTGGEIDAGELLARGLSHALDEVVAG